MTFWSAEQEALRASARTFVEREVAPHLQQWEDARRAARASCTLAAAKQGFLGVSFPEEVGGERRRAARLGGADRGVLEAGAPAG